MGSLIFVRIRNASWATGREVLNDSAFIRWFGIDIFLLQYKIYPYKGVAAYNSLRENKFSPSRTDFFYFFFGGVGGASAKLTYTIGIHM